MSETTKKPPMRVSELGKVPETKKEPGELTYTSNPLAKKKKGKQKGSVESILLSALVAFLFSTVLVFFYCAPKDGLQVTNDNIIEVNERLEAFKAELTPKFDKIYEELNLSIAESRGAKSALDGYVKKGEIVIPDFDTTGLATEESLKETRDLALAVRDEVNLKLQEFSSSLSDYSWSSYTGWDSSIRFITGSNDVDIEFIPIRPIDKTGSYDLSIRLKNKTDHEVKFSPTFQVDLIPEKYIPLNKSITSLYTKAGGVAWTPNFENWSKSGEDVITRITFKSSVFKDVIIPANSYIDIPLVLDLAYS